MTKSKIQSRAYFWKSRSSIAKALWPWCVVQKNLRNFLAMKNFQPEGYGVYHNTTAILALLVLESVINNYWRSTPSSDKSSLSCSDRLKTLSNLKTINISHPKKVFRCWSLFRILLQESCTSFLFYVIAMVSAITVYCSTV